MDAEVGDRPVIGHPDFCASHIHEGIDPAYTIIPNHSGSITLPSIFSSSFHLPLSTKLPHPLISPITPNPTTTMSITIPITSHLATIIPNPPFTTTPLKIPTHILHNTGSNTTHIPTSSLPPEHSVIQSSLPPTSPSLIPNHNSLVYTITYAYNSYYHITLRPDNIWLGILRQFSFFALAHTHTESIRGKLISHDLDGKESRTLKVTYATEDRFSISTTDLTARITALMEENIPDPELRAWIPPALSTTTSDAPLSHQSGLWVRCQPRHMMWRMRLKSLVGFRVLRC